MRLKIVTMFAVGLLGLVVGCSNEVGPKKYDVSGAVKVDGKESRRGRSSFNPTIKASVQREERSRMENTH